MPDFRRPALRRRLVQKDVPSCAEHQLPPSYNGRTHDVHRPARLLKQYKTDKTRSAHRRSGAHIMEVGRGYAQRGCHRGACIGWWLHISWWSSGGYVQRMCRRKRVLTVGCTYHGGRTGICAADVPQEARIDGRLHISLLQIPASGITRHTNYAPTIRLDDCACARAKR